MTKIQNLKITIYIIIAIVAVALICLKLWDDKETLKPFKEKRDAQVILYVKNGCRFCTMAEELLDKNNIAYDAIDIGSNVTLQQRLINQTKQTTVPFVFIKNKFIGGYTDLVELHEKGEL